MSFILPPPPVDPCASTLPPPPESIRQCRCGCVYSQDEWCRLPFVGHQSDCEGGLMELRNCICSSTISIQVVSS